MTHSVQHSVANRVRSYTVPTLSVRSLFLATAIASGIAYLVCVLFLTVAPQAPMAFFSYVLTLICLALSEALPGEALSSVFSFGVWVQVCMQLSLLAFTTSFW